MLKGLFTEINRRYYHPDLAALLLRITLGGLLLFHGWHKVHGGIGFILGMATVFIWGKWSRRY